MLRFLSEIRELMHNPYCRLSIAERGRLGSAVMLFFMIFNLVIFELADLLGLFK